MTQIVRCSDGELIDGIRQRAVELQKKAFAVELEEGLHRSSTRDDYYRGGAAALLALASELEPPLLKPKDVNR